MIFLVFIQVFGANLGLDIADLDGQLVYVCFFDPG